MTENPYTVVGAGAIGGTLAAHLHAQGVPVQLVDADPLHVAAIRENGLQIKSPSGVLAADVPCYGLDDAPATLERVLLAVKAQATDSAAAWIAPRLSSGGYVASLQNGLNEATIARHVGAERTVIAFVDLFADVLEPGVINDGGIGAMALASSPAAPATGCGSWPTTCAIGALRRSQTTSPVTSGPNWGSGPC